MKISIGKTIMLYRKNKNWSQSDLGEAAGISRNYVSMIERDDANVTIGTLEAVCAVLGISVSIVLGGLESRLTKRAADGLERVALHCTCPTDANHQDCPVHGTSRR